MKRVPYELRLESRDADDPRRYTFRTVDGVCSKDSLRDAELLLVESLWEGSLGRLLVPEANYGVVGTVLAERATSVTFAESSTRAARFCELNAEANDADVSVGLRADLTAFDETFDSVAYAPKPYTPLALGKQRIADAFSVLEPGGAFFLAASKRTGLGRYEDCLDELAASVDRGPRYGDHRLVAATRPRSFDPPRYVTPRTIRPVVDGVELSLITVPGLFSASTLDDGTRLLLKSAAVEDGERVLDLCCGYGAIGAYAGLAADCEVWLSDDDRVATRCAECSLRASGVDGTVVTADCVDGVRDVSFDRVICNPPTHAGDGVLSELFSGARDVLVPDGELIVVHHRTLDFRRHLSRFDAVERLREGPEHVVLRVRA